ncbi:MAG: TIGR01212 family radical SAM protein [Lachnospiraceae bacterium]|nr:TIGR01212 family radical SAM protein [Lachnospiraceae bacterium]
MRVRMISDVLKEQYGEKIYRLALSSGCTCPNRDGTLGTGGCTFCSEGGSGEFASKPAPIAEQIEAAKKLVSAKTKGSRFIAYFQSYTNTYGDVNRLRALYTETVERDDIVILSVGTRPDCLPDEMISMFAELNRIKPVWVELGLQTTHDETAARINRCYPLSTFEDAYRRLTEAGLTVIVHLIFGLPGENEDDMLDSVRYLAKLTPPPGGVKLQLLQILRGTKMAEEYERSPWPVMTLTEYAELIKKALRLLPSGTVIHRLTGDGPKSLLIEPQWCADKKRVLNTLRRSLTEDEKPGV